ncbi:MAG: hypothetical protein IPG45_16385 [Deltaproteobacteria bacterium]|nr:hypothetical protein [Deltaproteobacteria bacterium]
MTEARRRMAGGESHRASVKALDLHEGTLGKWMDRHPAGRLQPVQIMADEEPARSAGISVATPVGFLIDGLDIEGVIRLWERLR